MSPIRLALLLTLSLSPSAFPQTAPQLGPDTGPQRVYYDYLDTESGPLRGGVLLIDPANPLHRRDFVLDPVPDTRGA